MASSSTSISNPAVRPGVGDSILLGFAAGAYLAGAVWRTLHILYLHPATKAVFSDMSGYFYHARSWVDQPGSETISDLVVPPGGHMFFGVFYWLNKFWVPTYDPIRSWTAAIVAQLVLSLLVPLLVGAIGYELYGRRVALVALLMSSLYFPIIHYASFFLTEGPYTFFLVLSLWLLIRSIRVADYRAALAIGVAAGVSLGITTALKPVVLVPALLVFGWLVLAAVRHRWSRLGLVLSTSALGLIVVMTPLSIRATRLNEGRFCLISTNGAHNILMGHYGHKHIFNFTDPVRGYHHGWGCPTACDEGYTEDVYFNFGAYDSAKALSTAWQWIRENPAFALQLSGEHVHELFYGTMPWPLAETTTWRYMTITYQWIFRLLILLPAVLFLALHWRDLARLEGPGLGDMLLVLPIIGLMIAAFITLGEPRFRVPYDTLLIVLAARFFTMGISRPDGLMPPPRFSEVAPPAPVAS